MGNGYINIMFVSPDLTTKLIKMQRSKLKENVLTNANYIFTDISLSYLLIGTNLKLTQDHKASILFIFYIQKKCKFNYFKGDYKSC